MILFVQSVKMTLFSREANPAIQMQEGEINSSCFRKMTTVITAKRTKRQLLGDLIILLVAIPTLVGCSIWLHTTMRSDWLKDVRMRWRILVLGLSLLFVSLLICFYATHRLGLSIWKSQQQQILSTGRIRRRTISSRGGLPAPLIATDSEMQLMVGGELPPSYESVMADLPPPYCSILVRDEKAAEVTRSLNVHRNLLTVPSGTG